MCHCLTCNRYNLYCDNPACPNAECDQCRDLREELAEQVAADPPEDATMPHDGDGRR